MSQNSSIVWLSLLLPCVLVAGCHLKPEITLERRVPVDVVGDCVALRLGLSECPQDSAELILGRRAHRDPQLARRLADPRQHAAAIKGVEEELLREANLAQEARRAQCRLVAADSPPPNPEDVARLHQCLPLPCRERLACLRPLMMAAPPQRRDGR